MALTKCKSCGAQISSAAKSCPQCGHPAPTHTTATTWVLGGIIVFAVGSCIFRTGGGGSTTTPAPVVASAPEPSSTETTPTATLKAWQYETFDDSMRHATGRQARMSSDEDLDFSFPYNHHPNYVSLVFQDVPGRGKSVYLEVAHGQFNCGLGCVVSVKGDGGPIQRLSARGAAAGNTDTIFLPYGPTLAAVRKAKVLLVEAPFWQEGDRQIHFPVTGLDWK